jgi:hypothetical protein
MRRSLGLPLFVATRAGDVPAVARPPWSVDGTVPGSALAWDHHRTGEAINLDALPPRVDPGAARGLGTTLADTDAVCSAVAVLLGGPAALPARVEAVFRAASWWCDHLRLPAGTPPRVGRAARRLDAWVNAALVAGGPAGRSAVFARLVRALARRVRAGRALPGASRRADRRLKRWLRASGRLRVPAGADAVVVDLRGVPEAERPSVAAIYAAAPRVAVGVVVEDHPAGGPRYTVGRHPAARAGGPSLLGALGALAAAEFAHGPPARAPEAVPGAETWGGRADVFGSPWNYGSRLGVAEVLAALAAHGFARAAAAGAAPAGDVLGDR